MADMSWMLNPKAIRQSKECIRIVKELTGMRLKLSDPDFLQSLHEHVDLSGSRRLGDAYAELIAMAGVGALVHSLQPREVVACEDTPLYRAAAGEEILGGNGDTVDWSGKSYPRYRSGREFKGVYRGQPRYA